MIRVCPICGTENGLTSVHCRNCRAKLPEPAVGMMDPSSSPSRRQSFLRSAFWVLILLAIGAAGFWAHENMDWQDVRSGASGCYAKWQCVQSAVSGAVHRWYAKWLTPEGVPAPGPAATSAPAPLPAPAPENVVKIRCPWCAGLGYRMVNTRKDIIKADKITCTLCNGKGGCTIILPADAEVCPLCHGMGKITGVVNGRIASSVCKMCAGKGFVVRKY